MSAGRRRAAGRSIRLAAAAALVSALIAGEAWLGLGIVRAATPSPSVAPGGDTRSPGEGPGFVGAPLLAIGGVLFVGVLAVAGTLTYVRLTGGPRRDPTDDRWPPTSGRR